MTTDPRYPIGRFTPLAEHTPALRAGFLADITDAPVRLREAVHNLTIDQRQAPYREGGWTVAQVVHHLADSHMNAFIRFKLAITEDEPTIKPYKEAAWAELPDGADVDISQSLRLLEGLHARWAVLIHHLTPDQYARTMIHPERGPMTVDRCLALYAWHGRHHVAHVTSLRERMGW